MAGCGVPANHLPRWVLLHALLARGSVDGATNLCSPSTVAKFNCLVIRYLYFRSVRGDLQEDHVYDKRLCGYGSDANFLSSWCQSPSSRAQNRHFCALFAFGTLIFGHFEHKIEVFVRFLPLEPSFSGLSSTKSGFLCFFGCRNPHFRAFRARNRHFCAREEMIL